MTEKCRVPHPEMDGVFCGLREQRDSHREHMGMVDLEPVYWPNAEYVPPPSQSDLARLVKTKADLDAIAAAVPREEKRQVFGKRDPWTSRVAAERIEPKRGTRKREVFDALVLANGEWVKGSLLCTVDCGGSEGLKRVRELRYENGWPVERRPDPDSATAWEYRLVLAMVPT